MAGDNRFYANGIDGSTGRYLLDPQSPEDVYELAKSGLVPRGDLHQLELQRRHERGTRPDQALAVGDPRLLEQAGWGVIFPQGTSSDDPIYKALGPLLDRRRSEAGREHAHFYREYLGRDGVGPQETKQQFLSRHQVGLGMPADPAFMPYYLLLVGSPEMISFQFQYELDVEYAVGRICFTTEEEYARYAASVVAAEKERGELRRRAVLFAAQSPGDEATRLSSECLVPPLARVLRESRPGWDVQTIVGAEATRDRLAATLSTEAPALLFTASHGMYFPSEDPLHQLRTGALLCSDWPGPRFTGRVPEQFYFAADDVSPDARFMGTIAVCFACFGAGIPAQEDFPQERRLNRGRPIANQPFVAALPRKLLTHPQGGALAVVGHIERTWAYSFLNDQDQPQIQVFRAALEQLLDGCPVGLAMEWFNQRYASMATLLTGALNHFLNRRQLDEKDLLQTASLWTGHHDARSYVVIGDPAVRLRVGKRSTQPQLETTSSMKETLQPMPPTIDPTPTGTATNQHPLPLKVLTATEQRIQALFKPTNLRESFSLPADGTPAKRQAALREALEKRSPAERLRSNPPDAVERRLRRIGVPISTANRVARERAFAILETLPASATIGLERIIGRNELLGIRYLDGGQFAARAVGRVVIRSSTGHDLGYGTGSLVSPRLLLTNNHVLESAQRSATSVVEFNYQVGLDNQFLTRVTFRLDPQTFFVTSPEEELDFTLVAVGAAVGGGRLADFGFNPLTAVADEVIDGESVTIIQHPSGEPKQIALRENRVLKLPNTADRFLYYETDTTPGSSGAPVFNDQWEVVALHHSGFPARDAAGNYLTPEGQIWTPAMGEQRIHWIANEGIRVAALVEFLGQQGGLTAAQGQLWDETVHPPARQWVRQPEGPTTATVPVTQSPEVASQSVTTVAGQAVWTIPLQVTVNLAAPTFLQSAVIPGVKSPVAASGGAWPVASGLQSTDIHTAKAEFERAATRTYFDSAADQTARTTYYRDLGQHISPSALFDALHQLLESTHGTRPAYKPAVELYPWIDLHPDRRIHSIYSGKVSSPLELIELDFEIEQRRQERLMRFQTREATADPARLALEAELLEAQLPFNCEHTVPQSWFAKKEPMRGDLHHLFACETGCNSFRGNIPYFDFPDFNEVIRSDCGKRESNRFEPSTGKGAVARATLYFLLRYPGQIDHSANGYTADRIAMLLGWHKQFSPEEYERHRNQAIFMKQGNRNPLIDFPDLADKIDFTRGLG